MSAIALILNEAVTSSEFLPEVEFYLLSKYYLSKTMEVREVACVDWRTIGDAIQAIPDGCLKFLILRGHGTRAQFIDFSDMADPKCVRVSRFTIGNFKAILPKLAPDSYIVLDSCEAGAYDIDSNWYENVAMSFAKLTYMRSDVRIIAPGAKSRGCGIFPAPGGKWCFEIPDLDVKNVAYCYGRAVKAQIKSPGRGNCLQFDIELDTHGVLYDIAPIARIAAALPPKSGMWFTVKNIEVVIRRPEAIADAKSVFVGLLNYLAPEQMTNGREFKHMSGAAPIERRNSSLLLKCLIRAARFPSAPIAGWISEIRRWAAARDEVCAARVNDVIDRFESSPLAISYADFVAPAAEA